MREQLIKALLAHAQGDIAKHRANVEVYLQSPVGIGEHSSINSEYVFIECDSFSSYLYELPHFLKDIRVCSYYITLIFSKKILIESLFRTFHPKSHIIR